MAPEAKQCRWAFQKGKMFVMSWLWLVLSLKTPRGREKGKREEDCVPSLTCWAGAVWGRLPKAQASLSCYCHPHKTEVGVVCSEPNLVSQWAFLQPSRRAQTLLWDRDAFVRATRCFLTPSAGYSWRQRGISGIVPYKWERNFFINNAEESLRSGGLKSNLTFFEPIIINVGKCSMYLK